MCASSPLSDLCLLFMSYLETSIFLSAVMCPIWLLLGFACNKWNADGWTWHSPCAAKQQLKSIKWWPTVSNGRGPLPVIPASLNPFTQCATESVALGSGSDCSALNHSPLGSNYIGIRWNKLQSWLIISRRTFKQNGQHPNKGSRLLRTLGDGHNTNSNEWSGNGDCAECNSYTSVFSSLDSGFKANWQSSDVWLGCNEGAHAQGAIKALCAVALIDRISLIDIHQGWPMQIKRKRDRNVIMIFSHQYRSNISFPRDKWC